MPTDAARSTPGDPIAWRPRMEAELAADQLLGIQAWHAARQAAEAADEQAPAGALSREMRLDLDRRLEVLRRQHEALVRRTEEQLAASGRLRRATAPPRALVVHRSDWFQDKLVDGLRECGVDVIGRLENGADAVGIAVAEQPDLLIVEDKLPMLSGEEVIRQVRQFSPMTIAVMQVSHDDAVDLAVEAGAHSAFARRVPPADLARDLCRLITP